ncbi:MAG TPA: SGNH/GDSL hydrolase family protein [Bacteroidales bacterium]|nr:SGNH/GDSL hydrolase family protein [Bacteroidales bacterium]HRZ76333.1 SGNH/GDSL hydrolase family protein [Bacteroidales bacterium]
MKTLKYLAFLLISAGILSCEPAIDDFEPNQGSADFSVYVALGNSLTAGYADGALYKSAQQTGYPVMLAAQFASVGGGAFKVPYMLDEYGLGGRRVLGPSTNCLGVTSLGPIMYPGTLNPANAAWIGDQGPFQNLGVPGARVSHLLAPGYGMLNPYYGRFASNPTTSSVLADALAQSPTFFSLWIGANDVLGYSTSGGDNCGDSLTTPEAFALYYGMLLDNLLAGGAKAVVANIPDVTSIPFFNTVPFAALVLTDQAQVDGLNAAYQALGFTFQLGPNPMVIQDLNAPAGMRQATPQDLILLTIPQDSIRCAGWGSMKPVPHRYVLDALEVTKVRNTINAFNLAIEAEADERGLAFVDANGILRSAESGLVFDGVTLNTAFVSGGVFSLDGVHLTPKGNAVVANAFIDAINARFGASVPKVVVNDYPGVAFP